MKKETKLYNLIFPLWMIWMFPITWLIIIPGNFIIDSLILILSMLILKIDNKKLFYKKHILLVYLFGMLSDIIGSLLTFFMFFVLKIGECSDEIYLTLPGVLLASIMIFIFNYFITFKKIDMKNRLKLSLIFAIITAPYTFMLPIRWFY